MAVPQLRTVLGVKNSLRGLRDGSVRPSGFAFEFLDLGANGAAFRRMARASAFDVCELPMATYLTAKQAGKPLTALPIFVERRFLHGTIAVAPDVSDPRDFAGRRVGARGGYTVTSGVWGRGILCDEFDVDLDAVTWVLAGDEHVAEYRPPVNVETVAPGHDADTTPLTGSVDLAALIKSGDLAGGVGINPNRPGGPRRLFADPAAAGYAALRERGHYPISHLVAVREEVLMNNPDLTVELFTAFAAAKRDYLVALRSGTVVDPVPVDDMYRAVLDITGEDPLPYGIEPNRGMLDEFLRHAFDQHIIDAPVPVEMLFSKDAVDLVG